MRFRAAVVFLFALALVSSAAAGTKRSKPRLDLRATPRIAFSPAEVLVMAELAGGDEVEDLYCPGQEWDWGDGEHSRREADCEPFEPGVSLERLFSLRHVYRLAGVYEVRVTLRRADRTVAFASVQVTVHDRSASFE